METRLSASIKASAQGVIAESVLRACVHCGFCNATCPTYQLLGDELDGPRGRIYQIKQVLEGTRATASTQLHLDRCLTCRNCETTCPSGVQYGQLLDIGRAVVHAQVRRPWRRRLLHWLLREGVTRRRLFRAAHAGGRALRAVLPSTLRAKLTPAVPAAAWPRRVHARQVLLPEGCVQGTLAPAIDAATARVLDVLGIGTLRAPRGGCCGAIRQHLDDPAGALREARRNIDAWWPLLEAGRVEAIVSNASGCALMIRDYARLLRADPHYAAKAERISHSTLDPIELLAPRAEVLEAHAVAPAARRLVLQQPCTQQHGLKIRDRIEPLLARLGAQLLPVDEAHLCCGSAGTYSLLQPQLALRLRDRKLEQLLRASPQLIVTANIGCLTHLASGTTLPVRHWVEWVAEAVAPTAAPAG